MQEDYWGQEMASDEDFNGQPVFQLAVDTNIWSQANIWLWNLHRPESWLNMWSYFA